MNRRGSVKVRVALCCYYLKPAVMLRLARRAFRNWGDSIEFSVYSTNKAHGGDLASDVPCRFVGNELNDFSAYIAAVREFRDLGESGKKFGAYILLNDTLFLRHPTQTLVRLIFDDLMTVVECDAPVLSGKADTYRSLLQTSPFAIGLDLYIASFLFATNFSGIELLDRAFQSARDGLMLRSAVAMTGEGLPPKFQAFIRLHLKRVGRSRFAWKNTGHSDDVIGRKAGCVFLEHYISARFFQEGFIHPINSTALKRGALFAAYKGRRFVPKLLRAR